MSRSLITRGLGAALLALLPAFAAAAVPASWQFSSVSDALPAPSSPPVSGDIKPVFDDQQWSVATMVSDKGAMFGYRLDNAGAYHAWSIELGTNPKGVMIDKAGVIALAASEKYCIKVIFSFCFMDVPFGLLLQPDGSAVTGFSNTKPEAPVIAGSLPFWYFPGNFVDENKAGHIATTQVAADGSQQGVILMITGKNNSGVDQVAAAITPADVTWLAAINDNAAPQVLGYRGTDGGCYVYGDDCIPHEDDCDGHKHQVGQGHRQHGKGHGYGHDCDDESAAAAAPAPRSGGGSDTDSGEAVLVQANADGSHAIYTFPATLSSIARTTVKKSFPLALGNTVAVLRADVAQRNAVYPKRLLACTFNPAALDANADGVVDCAGGLRPLGADLATAVSSATVLGFTLNHDGLLLGNYGYNDAGIGLPFVVDLNALPPKATALSNLAANDDDWELETVTDLNAAGKLVGYGYRDCAATPQAFVLEPSAAAPASALRIEYSAFQRDTGVANGDTVTLAPVVSGGSGSYQFRLEQRRAGDAGWTLLRDWAAAAGSWTAPANDSETCLRLSVRDAAAPASVQTQVVRYISYTDDNSGGGGNGGGNGNGNGNGGGNNGNGNGNGGGSKATRNLALEGGDGGSFGVGDVLGGVDGLTLLLGLGLGLLRRRR